MKEYDDEIEFTRKKRKLARGAEGPLCNSSRATNGPRAIVWTGLNQAIMILKCQTKLNVIVMKYILRECWQKYITQQKVHILAQMNVAISTVLVYF